MRHDDQSQQLFENLHGNDDEAGAIRQPREARGRGRQPVEVPDFLLVGEVAERLSFTPRRIYAMVHERKIPHYKVGRQLRFDPAKLLSWLEECERPVLSD